MAEESKPIIALEERLAQDAMLSSPSAARNRDAIRDTFLAHMPTQGRILEIASGTGEHAVHIAAAVPGLLWSPGDPDPASRASIDAWRRRLALPNVAPAHAIDATAAPWPIEAGSMAGVVSINMIHIAPFDATRGLIGEAGRILVTGGKLFLYGPFARNGAHTAPSNASFDASLKERTPGWGVRDLDLDIAPLAAKAGLQLERAVDMPANNLSVIFRRTD